ncbi:MBG domain-containing protein [Empedobacter falsenii]
MRKRYLFFWLWFIITIVVNAQSSTETFETESVGSINFTDNGVVFNIISHKGTFNIYRLNGSGWSGISADNQFIGNNTLPTENASFSIKTTSNLFRMNRFWIYLSDVNDNQFVTGTLTIVGKLNGVTKYSTTKTSGFNTDIVYANGHTLIDLTNLNGQNYSNIVIDELVITAGGDYAYMGFDAFRWVKDSNIILDPKPRITSTSFSGTFGVPFSEKIAATNGPILFNVTDGFLPSGLILTNTTGGLSGTPTSAGNFNTTFTALNNDGVSPSQIITFNIAKANQAINLPNLIKTSSDSPIALPKLTNEGNTLSYTSSDTNIARIENNSGNPTIIHQGNGVATITATALETITHNSFSSTFTITFEPEQNIEITGVEDNKFYNTNVTPQFNVGTATLNGSHYTSGTTISAEGSYTLTVTAGHQFKTIQFQIDKTPPSVSGVTNGGIYNTNRTISFNEGKATLNGSSYSSGSVVSSEGHYTIMVTDNAGNTATVNFVIDKTAPIITSLSVPPNTTYTKNQHLYFIVNFSEAIDLTAVPTISIEIGIKTVQANYVSLPNTSSLTFRYIVQRSDYDADGIKVKSLNFNEGSIKDFAGNDANLTLNGVGSTTGVLVDARESDLAVVSTIDKPISELNETVNFTVTATNLGPDDANNVSVNITLPQGINFVSATPSQGSYNNGTGMWSIGNINEGETKHLTLTSQVNTIGSETLTAIVSSTILDPNPSNNSSSATVNIDKKSQQITFNPFALITYGDVAKPLTATSSSGLEITYTSSDPTIAEVNRVNSVWIVTPKAVGQVNIIASQIGNNEYVTAVSVTQALTIIPAALTITADSKSKVYGSTDPTLTYQITAGKLVGTDQLTGNLARDAGENVGNYLITQGTLAASTNYNVTYQKADFAITKASLAVTADAKSKVYGSTDPTLTYQITAGKLIGSDKLTGNLSRVSGEDVGNYPITQGTLAASPNYNLTYQKADFAITKASLAVTADAKSKVYGSTDPTLTYQITSGKLVGTDQLTGSLARDAGENVGTYVINQGTLNASTNYNFTYQKADLAITKANLTVTADAKSKVYGSTDPTLTYQITSGKLVGTDQLTGSLARDAGENVGNYPITQGTLAASTNYNFTYQKADLAITKANLTVTADAQSKVYGSTDPTLTYQITAGKLIGSDKLTGNLSRVSGEDVGNYTINQGTLNASANYDFTYKKADFNITKASLTVTADPQSKVYGSTDPRLTYKITSGKLIGTDQLTGGLARDTGENVGSYVINQGTLAASPNYNFTYQKADLAITPASLTVTADAKSKVYGSTDPTLTYQITSGKLIGTDQLTGSLARDAGENVGNYPITQGTLAASPNYNFTYQKADLAITPASLTITADAKSKVYGTNDPALTYQITSGKLIGSDQLTGSLARDAGENVGNYPITQGTLAASPNYNFTYKKADFDITKAGLTVTADAKSKVYGSTDPTLTYQITAGKLIGSDKLTGNLSRVSGENVGSYVINQGTLNASANYNFTYQKADLAITPASLTVTADAKSKVYGSTDPALTYQITAGKLIGSDKLTGNLSRVSGENVGSYVINQGTLNASANYTLTYQNADFEITKAGLTVTADAKSKVYGTNDPVLTYQITAGKLIGSDKLTGNLSRVSGENVGTYAINQGTLNASTNYNFTYQKADLEITPASLTVTADAKSKIYGSTDPTLTYQITSGKLIGSDKLTGNLSRVSGENVGTYAINQGTLNASTNYNLTYQKADLAITKASLVGITFNDNSFTYDGTNKSLAITGTLPKDVGVSYVNNNQSQAGTYTVTANITGGNNYQDQTLTADLTINKATQVITWTQDLTIGCDGENTLVLNATASSDLPVYYTSSNSTIATVIGNSLTFNKQGFADITAQQDGNNNYLPATHVIKQVNMRLIGKVKKKWEDVLIFDNSSDDFVSWQWYKDGQAIVGAQGQYYTSPTPLNGSYMVVVKDKDGNTMETCPLVIVAGQHKGGVKVVPNPARQGTTFTIKADYPSEELKGAKIMITDITGKLNKEINQVSPEVVTQVPMVPGIYIIYLFLENGKRESVKLLVN